MNLPTTTQALAVIATVAAVTIFCRALPFLFFRGDRPAPGAVLYLGKVLPFAIMPMLVVYCLRGLDFTSMPFGAPELIACALVIVVHLWKRNNLLSIGAGTATYMLLIQHLF